MKKALVITLCLLVTAPAYAQTTAEKRAEHKTGTIKLWVGVGLIGFGGLLAAASGTSVSSPVYTGIGTTGVTNIQTSIRSNGQLYGGIALAGGGAFLLWNGLKQREAAERPFLGPAVAIGTRGVAFYVRRIW